MPNRRSRRSIIGRFAHECWAQPTEKVGQASRLSGQAGRLTHLIASGPITTVLVVAVSFLAIPLRSLHAQSGGPTAVYATPAVAKEVAAGINVVGDVEAIRRTTVASKEAGAVILFPRREGEFVETGEVLAQLESNVLELELASAQAILQARLDELAELKNGTRKEVLEAGKARLRAAEAMQQLAKQKLERTTKLQKQSAASIEEHDVTVAQSLSAQAEVELRQAELDELIAGPRSEKIAQAEALAKSQQGVVDRLKAQLDRHTVRAPFAGYLTKEHTQVGAWVDQGGPVVDLIELREVDIRVAVPSRYAGRVLLDQEVRVDVTSAEDRLLVGKVRYIVPEVDLRSRLFPIKVRLANTFVDKQPVLRAGMLAKVELPVGEKQKGVYVPKDALVLGRGTPLVYVVRRIPNGKDGALQEVAAAEPVELGTAVGDLIQVEGAVQAGDLVVVQGNERLRPNTPVKVLDGSAESPPK